MTAIPQVSKNVCTPPKGLFWHEPTGRWCSKIGYHTAKSGRRVRSYQYYQHEYSQSGCKAAEREFRATQGDWYRLVDQVQHANKERVAVLGRDAKVTPVWPTGRRQRVNQGTPESPASVEPTPVLKIAGAPHTSNATLREVIEAFFAEYYLRIGKAGKLHVQPDTYRIRRTSTNLAVSPRPAKKIKADNPDATPEEIIEWAAMSPIDASKRLCDLTKADLKAFISYWWSAWIKLSNTTRANYCKMLFEVLEWAEQEDDLNWSLPKGAKRLFDFGNVDQTKIAKYDPEELLLIKKSFPERFWLYCLIALNVGGYQEDVALLRFAEIKKMVDGELVQASYAEIKNYDGSYDLYVERTRNRTRHKYPYAAVHLLWPETAKLLAKHLAPADNPFGVCLLSRAGTLLVSKSAKKGKSDAISNLWWRQRRKIAKAGGVLKITYKQLRKIGVTEIGKYAVDGTTAIRLYRSQPPLGDASATSWTITWRSCIPLSDDGRNGWSRTRFLHRDHAVQAFRSSSSSFAISLAWP